MWCTGRDLRMVGVGIFYYLTENSKGYLLVTRAAETLSECVNISNKHVRKSPSKNLLSVHTYYSHLCSQWTCQAPVWACCGRLALVYSAPWARNRLVSTTRSSSNNNTTTQTYSQPIIALFTPHCVFTAGVSTHEKLGKFDLKK